MIINVQNLAVLFQAYKAAYQGAFDQAPTLWDRIATLIPSATESNFYAFLGQFPKLREWLGDRQIKNIATSNYSLANKQFESTVAVPRPKLEDDTYGVFTPLIAEMGYAAKVHPDELVFAGLAAGAASLCYDGQFFFDTDHPVIVNGVASTKSNYDATGGGSMWVLADTSRPLKPMIFQKRKDYEFQQFNRPTDEHVFMKNEFLYGVDARCNVGYGLWQLAYASLNTLNSTNFDAAVTAMQSLRSDEDRPLGVRPNLLIVSPANRAAARALIETQFLSSGASNPNYKEVEVMVSPFLT